MKTATCRAIEYEVVTCHEAINMGLISDRIPTLFMQKQIAVLRCVDRRGQKLTALTDAQRFKELLASGDASDPEGMALDERDFPIVYPGWLQAG